MFAMLGIPVVLDKRAAWAAAGLFRAMKCAAPMGFMGGGRGPLYIGRSNGGSFGKCESLKGSVTPGWLMGWLSRNRASWGSMGGNGITRLGGLPGLRDNHLFIKQRAEAGGGCVIYLDVVQSL